MTYDFHCKYQPTYLQTNYKLYSNLIFYFQYTMIVLKQNQLSSNPVKVPVMWIFKNKSIFWHLLIENFDYNYRKFQWLHWPIIHAVKKNFVNSSKNHQSTYWKTEVVYFKNSDQANKNKLNIWAFTRKWCHKEVF